MGLKPSVMKMKVILLVGIFAAISSLHADDLLNQKKHQWVTLFPVATVTVTKSKPAKAVINFRVEQGYHINSNHPTSELLIPTEIKLDPAQGLSIGKIAYPPGQDMSLSFAPDEKLNVYAGEVSVAVPVSAGKSTAPGEYVLKGQLRYQACNDNSCFPPKNIPLEVPVKVVR
jgi:DsbC/DsbD-like thiol-disulfide interchange protein